MYEAEKGEMFYNFTERMKSEMFYTREKQRLLIFNDIEITIHQDSNLNDISIIYYLKRQIK